VHVPTVAEEDGRHKHREVLELKTQRTGHVNRIKGLLAGLGLSIVVNDKLPVHLERLRQWDESPVPPELKQRILRGFERWKTADSTGLQVLGF
jgi:transposase